MTCVQPGCQEYVFLHENGKSVLYQLGDLIEAKKIASITMHAPFPRGVAPKSLSLEGLRAQRFFMSYILGSDYAKLCFDPFS